MAGNFIIQFIGREGSSAIISALSAQKGVNVPLFEELDEYCFLKTHKIDDYPQVLDGIFSEGASIIEPNKAIHMRSHAATDKVKSTGFKWRIDGHLPDIAKVLSKHNVTVFSLQRRDFLGYVCSQYVHNHGNQLQSDMDVPLHPHFHKEYETLNGSDPEQREKLNTQAFRLDKPLFLATAKEAANIRKKQAGKSRHLARLGVPLKMMFYEDFDADPKGFIVRYLADIGHDISREYNPYCGFKKVHKRPLSERIIGLEKATRSWRYRHFKKEYHAAIQATNALCNA